MPSRFCAALAPLLLAFVPVAAAQSPIPDGAVLERIASGLQFTEGPIWMDGALLFSDIPADRVYRWTEADGLSVFRQPSQHSNGLALDADGRLLLAQHGARRVARLEGDAEVPLATEYDGQTLNSPNDIAVHPDGSLYFTDPTWGVDGRPAPLGFTGVYRLAPDGALTLLVDSLYQPNGIAFSPDHATLYVSTSDQRTVVAYDVADHALSNGRVFVEMTGGASYDAADGMEVDAAGNLWTSGTRGVWVVAPDGTVLDVLDVPGQTTNVAWGDADGQTLYVTSGPNVYRLRVGATTAAETPVEAVPLAIRSVSPNPARDHARLDYALAAPGLVRVVVLDALGREVWAHDAGAQPAGPHTLQIDLGALPPGPYRVWLDAGTASVSRAFTVAR